MSIIDADLQSIQEARILLEQSAEAKANVLYLERQRFERAIDIVLEIAKDEAKRYIELAFEETDIGCPEDEQRLLELLLQEIQSKRDHLVIIGQQERDSRSKATKLVVSRGPAVSLLPAWLSVHTMLHHLVLAIATGSPIVFATHARGDHRLSAFIDRIAGELEGVLPMHFVQTLHNNSQEGRNVLCSSEEIALVISHEPLPKTLREVCDQKTFFVATVGNTPVFIERTADIRQAAQEIVASKSLNLGLIPGAEESIVVEKVVEEDFRRAMQQAGAYFLSKDEEQRLAKVLYDSEGKLLFELIGKTCKDLARRASISLPEGVKILVVEKPYVSENSPYTLPKLTPVISYYIEEDWRNACEKCVEILLKAHDAHSLSIYSQDEEVIEQFTVKKPVARVLVNVGASLAATGFTSSLPVSFSLTEASRSLENGPNLNAGHFIYHRVAVERTKTLKEEFGSCSQGAYREEPRVTPLDANGQQNSCETLFEAFLQGLQQK